MKFKMKLLKTFLLSLLLAVTTSQVQSQVVVASSYQHFTPEYKAVLNQAVTLVYTTPSIPQRYKGNTVIRTLKADNNWTLIDVFYMLATDGGTDFATLNWKTPASFQITRVNSPTFNSNQGFQSNGTTSYLNTTWVPSTSAVNFVLNDACLGIWVHTATDGGAATRVFAGANNTANTASLLIMDLNASVVTGRVNTSTSSNPSFGINSFVGGSFYTTRRTASNATATFIDGAQQTTSTLASVSRPNQSIYLLANHGNTGAAGSFSLSNWKLSLFFTSSSGIDQASFYNAINTYMANP